MPGKVAEEETVTGSGTEVKIRTGTGTGTGTGTEMAIEDRGTSVQVQQSALTQSLHQFDAGHLGSISFERVGALTVLIALCHMRDSSVFDQTLGAREEILQ